MRDYVKPYVDKLIHKYDETNIFKLLNTMNIGVIHRPLKDAMGMTMKSGRSRVIIVNNQVSREKQEFICAHELGHIILHPEINMSYLKKYTLFSVDKKERQANFFAFEYIFGRRQYISQAELLIDYEFEPELLQDFLGIRLVGQSGFWNQNS